MNDLTISTHPQAANEPRSHHTERGFRNNYDNTPHGASELFRWQWETVRARAQGEAPAPRDYNFPLALNDPAFLKKNQTRPTLTWIGHASFLIQVEGLNILTDPHFTERASPLTWAGPKRFTPPGLRLEDLPAIDAVLLSHNHYDHLDLRSVLGLMGLQAAYHRLHFFVPLGVKSWFTKLGISQVTELDWWQGVDYQGWRLHCLPVQHFSGRSLWDRNQTLWCGWGFQHSRFNGFFAGDTGYSQDFRNIGRALGPFDLSLIPIGAYDPRWFMKPVHVAPEEAVQIHKDLRSRLSVGMHWGTFKLTSEPLDEPPQRLVKACAQFDVPTEEFLVMQHGQTLLLDM